MNIKHFVAGFALGVIMAVTPSCGTKTCNASTCRTGCCDTKGECQSGASQGACGQLGGTCQVCGLGTACNLGTCMTTAFGGGTQGGGGGSNGGGTGGSNGGGTGGANGGGTGGGGACDGCIATGGVCISRANSGTNSFCGQGGVACATCGGGENCVNYVCQGNTGGGGTTGGGTGGGTTGGGTGGGTTGGGTGGGTTGGGGGGTAFVGMPCTSNAQCTTLGAGAKCKLATTPFGGNAPSNFPPGQSFCTVPCTGPGTCAGGNVCAGGASSFPFLFNDTDRYCVNPCTPGVGACPIAAHQCIQVDALTATGATGCTFVIAADAGLFTGGGNPTNAGNTCATDTDCANPPDPVLATCQMPPAFPNGYCTANSRFAPADTWCDQAGKTELGFGLSDGGSLFLCAGTCNTPGSVGTSRTGYTCFRKSATMTNIGVLWPKCQSSTECASDPMGRTQCNLTSGFCCPTATSTTGCAIDFFE